MHQSPRRLSVRPRFFLSLTLLATLAFSGCAHTGVDVRLPKRAVTVYAGRYSDSALTEEILISKRPGFESSEMGAIAYSQAFHRFWDGGGQWEWEGQLTKHAGQQTNWELNGLVTGRWMRYPWSEWVRTSAAVGNGLSWASEIPDVEESSHTNTGASQLLYYILLELTAGVPKWKHWDAVLRIHHRSGVFGLFDGVDGGSNIICGGLKFSF